MFFLLFFWGGVSRGVPWDIYVLHFCRHVALNHNRLNMQPSFYSDFVFLKKVRPEAWALDLICLILPLSFPSAVCLSVHTNKCVGEGETVVSSCFV